MGISGDDYPNLDILNVVGYPKTNQPTINLLAHKQSYFVGEEALNKKSMLQLKFPVEDGMIVNWSDCVKIRHWCC